MNSCRICYKPLNKSTSFACSGKCATRYFQLKKVFSDEQIHKKMAKEVNMGFSYDEPSVIL